MDLKHRKALGKAIRRIRVDAEMTQEELGFEAGLERSYVSAVELATKDPSFTTIYKMVTALHCSMTYLFQIFEDEMTSQKKESPRRRGRPTAKA